MDRKLNQNVPDPILKWCLAGVPIILLYGTLLHFVYPWSGNHLLTAPYVPVNESVWEHLKMGYWGIVLFSIPEYFYLKSKVNNYFLAKLIGVILLNGTVLLVFYSYTYFTKEPILFLDIASFVLGIVFCQWAAFRLFKGKGITRIIDYIALLGFIGIGLLFAYLTFYPPEYPIFLDRIENKYGIP